MATKPSAAKPAPLSEDEVLPGSMFELSRRIRALEARVEELEALLIAGVKHGVNELWIAEVEAALREKPCPPS